MKGSSNSHLASKPKCLTVLQVIVSHPEDCSLMLDMSELSDGFEVSSKPKSWHLPLWNVWIVLLWSVHHSLQHPEGKLCLRGSDVDPDPGGGHVFWCCCICKRLRKYSSKMILTQEQEKWSWFHLSQCMFKSSFPCRMSDLRCGFTSKQHNCHPKLAYLQAQWRMPGGPTPVLCATWMSFMLKTGRRYCLLNQYINTRRGHGEGNGSDRPLNKWTLGLPEPAESARFSISFCRFPSGRQLAVYLGTADQRPLKITRVKSVIHDWNKRLRLDALAASGSRANI